MKQALVLVLLMSVVVNCFGQQTTPAPSIQSDYLKKSKNQKTASWILLGGGAVLLIVSAVIPKGEEQWDTYYLMPVKGNKNDGIKAALGLTGAVSMLVSIPLFIASGKNKKRALSVSADLHMQKSQVIRHASFSEKSYPAAAVKLNF